MSDEKIYNLLEKMYIEFNGRFEKVDNRFEVLENGIKELKSSQNKLEIRLETEVIDKIHVLFDARELQNDVNKEILQSLKRIEDKVSTHEEIIFKRIK